MEQQAWDIRLVALDLDGTLFTDQKTITPRTLAALTAALGQGVEVVPATGRPAAGLPATLLALPGLRYALTSNGARVWDLAQNAPVAEFLMQKPQAEAALRVLEGYDCVTDLFIEGRRISIASQLTRMERIISPAMLAYMRATRTEVEDIYGYLAASPALPEKVSVVFAGDAQRAEAWRRLESLGLGLVLSSSLDKNLEINAPGVTKGKGLCALARHLGLAKHQLMACGDSGNDLAMLEAAGLAVAMGNAEPGIRAAAAYVTATNEEDGVAKAVERFVLGRQAPCLAKRQASKPAVR